MIIPVHIGGKHAQTAALKNILAAQGVTAPHTGQAFSEAMLLGIGGGLGAGYILWEFKQHESANIVLGFRNRWNYTTQHLTTLCERMGAKPTVQEAGGAKAAAANLQAPLDAGKPCIAWVDKASLPYQQLPEALKGYGVWTVGVYGIENGAARHRRWDHCRVFSIRIRRQRPLSALSHLSPLQRRTHRFV